MKHYWHSSSCGRIYLPIPEEAIGDCSASGRNDDAVEYWAPRIFRPESVTPALLASCLKEFGAWDAEELEDDAANWQRWIWSACHDLADGAQGMEEVTRAVIFPGAAFLPSGDTLPLRAWTGGGYPGPGFRPTQAFRLIRSALFREQVRDWRRGWGDCPSADTLRLFWKRAHADAYATLGLN